MATPTIINVYPAPSAVGIPIGDRITVKFDQEMELDSINEGTFIVTGPDEAPVFGPHDITPFDTPGFDDEDILSSPYLKGYIKGNITFQKVDASGSILDDSITDTTGDGTLWNTVAIFTPEKPLKDSVEYKVVLAGDEVPTDDYDTGVRTRTIFDPVFSGSGTGIINFNGIFSGTTETTYKIEITSGGVTGTAEYIWWNENDPLTTYQGITTTGVRELENGIYVTCESDGSFTIGDTFTVIVKPGEVLTNNYEWTFSTGSGSILTPPSSSSTTGIEEIATNVIGEYPIASASFKILSVDPEDGEYGVAISTDPYQGEAITVTFNNPVEASTLAGDAIKLKSEPHNGDISCQNISYTGDLEFVAVLETTTKLVISLAPGQLYKNNIVLLKIADTVTDTSGNKLVENFEPFFSTIYEPLYTGLRIIQMDLGSAVSNIPEEIIMLAIYEASVIADGYSYGSIKNNDNFCLARKIFTTCMAEKILVNGILNGTGGERMTKKLGNLQVQRWGNNNDLKETMKRLEDCILTQLPILQTGGEMGLYTSMKPKASVKGVLAEDAIVVGRQWEPTSGIGINQQSAGNYKRYASGRRDLKTFRGRGRND